MCKWATFDETRITWNVISGNFASFIKIRPLNFHTELHWFLILDHRGFAMVLLAVLGSGVTTIYLPFGICISEVGADLDLLRPLLGIKVSAFAPSV